MRLCIINITVLICFVVLGAGVDTFAQSFDISSGGHPTITGAVNGSVTGTSNVLNNLSVTINFGEVSPANTNSIVKVVVPIAIRSTAAYRVTVSVTGAFNPNAQAVKASDIGFGVNNLRSLGEDARDCTRSSHLFYSPFSNDPTGSVTIAANGRAGYQSTLANVNNPTTILSGPRLTRGNNVAGQTDNGYAFNAIFAITPQFFAAGSFSATLTFAISSGPNAPC